MIAPRHIVLNSKRLTSFHDFPDCGICCLGNDLFIFGHQRLTLKKVHFRYIIRFGHTLSHELSQPLSTILYLSFSIDWDEILHDSLRNEREILILELIVSLPTSQFHIVSLRFILASN